MNFRHILAVYILAFAGSVQSAIVSLSPSAGSIGTRQQFVVNVVVSGLGTGQSVGGFDLDVVFDASVLSASSVVFGSALGVDGIDQFTSAMFSAGRIDFAAVSLLTELDLLALQMVPFSIATLTFNALQSGVSDIRFDLVSFPGLLLSDAFGNLLPATVGVESTVTVTGSGGTVPEPGLLGLALMALGILATRARQLTRATRPSEPWFRWPRQARDPSLHPV